MIALHHLYSALDRTDTALCPLQMAKKKVFERVQPDLRTTADKVAGWKDLAMQTDAGQITTASLSHARIS